MEETVDEKLYQAVCRRDIILINKLLARGACPNTTTSSGKTPLGAAASNGDTGIVQILLENCHASVSSPNASKINGMKWQHSQYAQVEYQPQYVCHSPVQSQSCGYLVSPMAIPNNIVEYPAMSSGMETPAYKLYPFSIDYSQQNQGYYVYIHEDKSPVDVSPEWGGSGMGAEGLEWDEEVGLEALPTTEDETWAALYKWYAQMLEQTEGLLGGGGGAASGGRPMERTPDSRDARQRSAAHYAAEHGHTGALQLLLHAGCKVNMVDGSGVTPLHLAVGGGHAGAAQILLAAGADPNHCTLGHNHAAPLHIAASQGHTHILELLVSAGAALEMRDGVERTALQVAAERGHAAAARLLMSAGANINVEDLKGSTPLCEAVWQGKACLVQALLNAGARAPPHHHLLHYSVLHRRTEVARLLVESGGCVDLRDDNGDTPLLLAARSGQPTLVELLLKYGASVDYPNSLTGNTALHEAVECIADFGTFQELFIHLQEHNVDLNATTITGLDTPLFRAILLQRDKAAKLLIKHGADVNLCVLDHVSVALKRRSMSVARLLVLAGAPPPPGWVRTPRPLTHLARLALRQHLSPRPLYRSVQALPLPTSLKGFLMLEDED